MIQVDIPFKVFMVIGGIITICKMAFLVSLVKNPPVVQEMQETQESQETSLGWEDPPGGGHINPL